MTISSSFALALIAQPDRVQKHLHKLKKPQKHEIINNAKF